jgi:hypothetical protein
MNYMSKRGGRNVDVILSKWLHFAIMFREGGGKTFVGERGMLRKQFLPCSKSYL